MGCPDTTDRIDVDGRGKYQLRGGGRNKAQDLIDRAAKKYSLVTILGT